MEEWIVKMMELAEIAKLTALVRGRTLSKFNDDWKPHFVENKQKL